MAELERFCGTGTARDACAEATWYVDLFHPWDGEGGEPCGRLRARCTILAQRLARARANGSYPGAADQ